jgi:hypothetical protein
VISPCGWVNACAHFEEVYGLRDSQPGERRRHVSSKRREQINQSHGATTQKICFLNNDAVKASNNCFLLVKSAFLYDYFIFLSHCVLFLRD